MADHIFEQCMDAVVAAVTGLTTTGSRVEADNVYPLDDDDLPGLTVVQGDAVIEPITQHYPRLVKVSLDIDVTAHAKNTTATAARSQLNLICKEVMAALYANRTLGGAAATLILVQATPDFSGEAEKPVASLLMRWQILTGWHENAPDVPAIVV